MATHPACSEPAPVKKNLEETHLAKPTCGEARLLLHQFFATPRTPWTPASLRNCSPKRYAFGHAPKLAESPPPLTCCIIHEAGLATPPPRAWRFPSDQSLPAKRTTDTPPSVAGPALLQFTHQAT